MGKKIKKPIPNTRVSKDKKSDLNYPIFCFKHFQNKTLDKCSEKQLKSFFDRLQRLGELGWDEINKGGKHNYGWETLSVKIIKHTLPAFVTPDVEKVYVFRYTNDNHPFIALRSDNIIHILLIEANFGDIYDHGKKK